MPRRIHGLPLRRWARKKRFWAALSLTLVVLVFATIYIAGQVFQRAMASPDLDDLPRGVASVTLAGAGSVSVSYVRSDRAAPRDGVPLIYVHGTPGDASNFVAFLRRPVAARFSVAIDRPGFGSSRSDRSFVSFEDQARAVIAVLDDLHIERAILVGHSLGGPIVARAAADHPERVAGIVEVAGSLDPDLEKLEWYNAALQWWPLQWLLPRAFLVSNEEVLAAREQCRQLQPRLGEIRCPVMIVHGTSDRLVPYENTAYMEAFFTGSSRVELRRLDGADHFVPWQQEFELREAIQTMVDWVEPSAGGSRPK